MHAYAWGGTKKVKLVESLALNKWEVYDAVGWSHVHDFRSPTKVERASLALRSVVLPPDGPPRLPGRAGAAPRTEIGRRSSLTRFVRDCVTNCDSCHTICDK